MRVANPDAVVGKSGCVDPSCCLSYHSHDSFVGTDLGCGGQWATSRPVCGRIECDMMCRFTNLIKFERFTQSGKLD